MYKKGLAILLLCSAVSSYTMERTAVVLKKEDYNGWNVGKAYQKIDNDKIADILTQIKKIKRNYTEQFAEFITYRSKPWKALEMDEYTKEMLEKHELNILDSQMWAVVIWDNL